MAWNATKGPTANRTTPFTVAYLGSQQVLVQDMLQLLRDNNLDTATLPSYFLHLYVRLAARPSSWFILASFSCSAKVLFWPGCFSVSSAFMAGVCMWNLWQSGLIQRGGKSGCQNCQKRSSNGGACGP